MVGCYVEGTDLVGKISLEDGGEKGDCVDHWIGALVLFQCTDMYVEKPSLGGGGRDLRKMIGRWMAKNMK